MESAPSNYKVGITFAIIQGRPKIKKRKQAKIMPREVMRNIYRIPVPLPNNPLRELNCYLIRGKDRSCLLYTSRCV